MRKPAGLPDASLLASLKKQVLKSHNIVPLSTSDVSFRGLCGKCGRVQTTSFAEKKQNATSHVLLPKEK